MTPAWPTLQCPSSSWRRITIIHALALPPCRSRPLQLGEATINLADFRTAPVGATTWLQLYHDGLPAGRLLVSVGLEGAGVQPQPQQQAQLAQQAPGIATGQQQQQQRPQQQQQQQQYSRAAVMPPMGPGGTQSAPPRW